MQGNQIISPKIINPMIGWKIATVSVDKALGFPIFPYPIPSPTIISPTIAGRAPTIYQRIDLFRRNGRNIINAIVDIGYADVGGEGVVADVDSVLLFVLVAVGLVEVVVWGQEVYSCSQGGVWV